MRTSCLALALLVAGCAIETEQEVSGESELVQGDLLEAKKTWIKRQFATSFGRKLLHGELMTSSEHEQFTKKAAHAELAAAKAYKTATLNLGKEIHKAVTSRADDSVFRDPALVAKMTEYAEHAFLVGDDAVTTQAHKLFADITKQGSGTPLARPISSAIDSLLMKQSMQGRILDMDSRSAETQALLREVIAKEETRVALLRAVTESNGDVRSFLNQAKAIEGISSVGLALGFVMTMVAHGPSAIEAAQRGEYADAMREIGMPTLVLLTLAYAGDLALLAFGKRGVVTVQSLGYIAAFCQGFVGAHSNNKDPNWASAVSIAGVGMQAIGSTLGFADMLAVVIRQGTSVTAGELLTAGSRANLWVGIGFALYGAGELLVAAREKEDEKRERIEDIAALWDGVLELDVAKAIASSIRVERPSSLSTCFNWDRATLRRAAHDVPFVFSDSDTMASACQFAKDFDLVKGDAIGSVLRDPKLGKTFWAQVNVLNPPTPGREGWCHAFEQRVLGIGRPLNENVVDRFCK